MSEISNTNLLELALDLANSLVNSDRFERLLDTARKTIPCDAVVLLALEDSVLKPLAIQGLTRDTLGRRFAIESHPRFKAICQSLTPVRFPADSPLPDPYDGLLMDRDGDLPIHSCMGLPLYFEKKLIGALTFDSLKQNMFEEIPQRTLDIISNMAAASLNTALTMLKLEQQASRSRLVANELQKEARERGGKELIGDSDAMKKLKAEINVVASSELSVLIVGETGTGKELVARTLHDQSGRCDEPLVYVNCAALPENLIESELFGHVKGAFTGADRNRAGKFSLADGGTIFLDEIGELPLALQSKLLRVLQDKEIQKLGQDKTEKVDVRVISATNRDLEQEVRKGHFRSDLYHRLSVYPIVVPSLRDRKSDIPILAGFFLEQTKRKLGRGQIKLTADALETLVRSHLPGNVRELEHLISRAALKASCQDTGKVVTIRKIHLGETPSLTVDREGSDDDYLDDGASYRKLPQRGFREATDDFQRKLLINVIKSNAGNVAAAARALELDRANLNRLCKRLGIKVEKKVNELRE